MTITHRPRSLATLAAIAAVAAVAAARPTLAQDVPNREAAIELRKQFITDLDSLHSKFVALAKAFPAEKYAWRPAPGIRSVGEVFMHVASEFYVYTPLAFGGTASPVVTFTQAGLKEFESHATKADALKHLDEGYTFARQAVMGRDPAAITGKYKAFRNDHTIIEMSPDMTDDLHEHLGQLIAYARMNGVVPPWSK